MSKKRILRFILGMTLAVFVASCSHQIDEVDPSSIMKEQLGNVSLVQKQDSMVGLRNARTAAETSSMKIVSTNPGLNTVTANTTVNYSNTCASYYSNFLQAKVIEILGMRLKIRIQRLGGLQFGQTGTLYIREGSTCGNLLNQGAVQSTLFYVDLYVMVNKPGKIDLYITASLGVTQQKYYSNPISVYSEEVMSVKTLASDVTKLPRNGIFGTVNSIQVYSNGYNYDYYEKDRSDNYGIDLGSKWQCVEWVRRFYYLAYGKRIGINTAYAKEFYLKCLNWGMKAYPNGSPDNIRTGDIVVFAATAKNEAGHVSLVTKVTPDYIEVAQQNVFGFAHLNYRINRTGNTLLKDTMGNTAIGWIR